MDKPRKPKLSSETAKFYGSKGGKARAKNLTAEKRKAIAVKAAQSRWKKKDETSI